MPRESQQDRRYRLFRVALLWADETMQDFGQAQVPPVHEEHVRQVALGRRTSAALNRAIDRYTTRRLGNLMDSLQNDPSAALAPHV